MARLEWDSEAEERLNRAPFLVRGMARRRIEKTARERGLKRVTVELLEQVKKREMGR